MSGPFGSSQWMYNASSGFYGYEIDQSLRFEKGSSAYLNRTPSSAGNRRTWTWSAWVKRSSLGTDFWLFSAGDGANLFDQNINFNTSDQLLLWNRGGGNLTTTQLFRDVSAWYHIVAVWNTTDATASDRMRLYVNGSEITSFSTDSNPSLNLEGSVNSTSYVHSIGRRLADGLYFDGYLSNIHFIDGTALDPTSFGETKSGVWIPKAYDGSYGTNGFHLEFNGNTNDTSGNGNNWTANNISTPDYMPDSPTNNFATLNVLTKGTSNTSLAEGNLKANATNEGSGSNWGTVFSSHLLPTTGKYYVEGLAFINAGAGNNSHLGVLDTSSFVPSHNNITYAYTTGEGFDGIYVSLFNNNAQPVSDGVLGTAEGSLTGTTVVAMLAVDIDNGKVWAGYNGTWLNSGNPSAGTNEIATRTFSDSDAIAVGTAYNGSNDQGMFANFGQDSAFAGLTTAGGNADDNGIGDFKYAVPSGFLALCSANLPEPVVGPLGNSLSGENFNTVLWTGNGTTQSITGVGFQPDLVWNKYRNSGSNWHNITDSVRGAGYRIFPNDTGVEQFSSTAYLTSFDADGFSLGGSNDFNLSSGSYVGWSWKAGGTAVSNTDGSITTSVSANTDAGFSIASFTGASTQGATFGHGLGIAPNMVIAKARTAAQHWWVYHSSLGYTKNTLLDLTNASATDNNTWLAEPTSSLVTIGDNFTTSNDYIAYCFAEVDGYSKVGSYVGNGSSNGPFIYTGFRPRYVLVKGSSLISEWYVWDAVRNTYNVANLTLNPNQSAAEYSAGALLLDLTANGFKVRDAVGSWNLSGHTYIYLAFAENPFKYANAR
jgi:hypothetical protein